MTAAAYVHCYCTRANGTINKTAIFLSAKKEAYVHNAEELKSEARASYQVNPNGKKAASKARYSFDPEKKSGLVWPV